MKASHALFVSALLGAGLAAQQQPKRPNILWISVEDISSHLGCYGDDYAVTPNLDKLAQQGVRFDQAFATIGVCAPARSTIISGMYPPSIGSQHMRCQGKLPKGAKPFTQYLREAGYYCTNNSKTDYNLRVGKAAWDESSRKAHWRKRKAGQPFFAVFNITVCHESQIRMPEKRYQQRTKNFTDAERHDPAKALVPPYHPNTPETRKDWARYADVITLMDKQVGRRLAELDAAGLADDTIVIFWSDHGAGMPRSKRWLYDSSIHVPMIARFPEKWRHLAGKEMAGGAPGKQTDRLVSFVDFAPSMLSLAGVEIPKHMQGKAFLGEQDAAPRTHVFGFRDRMDERYDMIRCVRNKRFKYIRNFMPHRVYAQHIDYMFQMPTMRVWKRMYDAGKLNDVQKAFFAQKPMEELYDVVADPHETKNLAGDEKHAGTLNALRGELENWMDRIVDLGFLPEYELRTRFGNQAPYDAVRANPDAYAYGRIYHAANLVGRKDPRLIPRLQQRLSAKDPAVRYWAAVALAALGDEAEAAKGRLGYMTSFLGEEKHPDVLVAMFDALHCVGGEFPQFHRRKLEPLLTHESEWVRLRTINLLDRMDSKASEYRAAMWKAAEDKNKYVVRVAKKALREMK